MSPASARSPALPAAIIVMGVSGCGKSTLGGLLAQALACPFLEGDDFHSPEAVEKMRRGMALTDEDRWPWLDRLGQAIASAGREQGVAVAACSALRRCYRDRLRGTIDGSVRFVLLENSRDALLARVGNRPGHYMPASLLDSQLATLERPQPDEGAMLLRTDLPATLLCDLVLGALR